MNFLYQSRKLKQTCLAIVTALVVLLSLFPTPVTHAHGGVIVNTGYTDQYEWLIALSPYPVTPGETIITLLIYDIDTYAPILDAHTEMTMTDSSSAVLGPFVMETDPEVYPGDYSTILQLDELTTWDGLFQVWEKEEDKLGDIAPLELSFTFEVMEGVREPTSTPVVEATETAFAVEVAAARSETPSPEGSNGEATPVAPAVDTSNNREPETKSNLNETASTATLSTPFTNESGPFGFSWLTLGLIAIVPLIMIGYWVMR